MTNDIQNLLSRFGATSESYLEVDDVPEYREPPVQAEKQEHLVAAPEEVAAAPAAKVIAVVSIQGGVGNSTLSAAWAGAVDGGGRRIVRDLDQQDTPGLYSRLKASVTHGHAS